MSAAIGAAVGSAYMMSTTNSSEMTFEEFLPILICCVFIFLGWYYFFVMEAKGAIDIDMCFFLFLIWPFVILFVSLFLAYIFK